MAQGSCGIFGFPSFLMLVSWAGLACNARQMQFARTLPQTKPSVNSNGVAGAPFTSLKPEISWNISRWARLVGVQRWWSISFHHCTYWGCHMGSSLRFHFFCNRQRSCGHSARCYDWPLQADVMAHFAFKGGASSIIMLGLRVICVFWSRTSLMSGARGLVWLCLAWIPAQSLREWCAFCARLWKQTFGITGRLNSRGFATVIVKVGTRVPNWFVQLVFLYSEWGQPNRCPNQQWTTEDGQCSKGIQGMPKSAQKMNFFKVAKVIMIFAFFRSSLVCHFSWGKALAIWLLFVQLEVWFIWFCQTSVVLLLKWKQRGHAADFFFWCPFIEQIVF